MFIWSLKVYLLLRNVVSRMECFFFTTRHKVMTFIMMSRQL